MLYGLQLMAVEQTNVARLLFMLKTMKTHQLHGQQM